MTKQEEIREGLGNVIAQWHPLVTGDLLDAILSYLHSQGVVIKVDRELPKECQDCALYRSYSGGGIKLLKAGYVVVEPLIKRQNE